jgi:hypothetical protein
MHSSRLVADRMRDEEEAEVPAVIVVISPRETLGPELDADTNFKGWPGVGSVGVRLRFRFGCLRGDWQGSVADRRGTARYAITLAGAARGAFGG